jgi:hypothetical protein
MRVETPGSAPGGFASRVLLGHRLQQLRECKGVECVDAASEAGVARATLWRMEKGDTRCRYKPGDMEQLGRLYGADRETLEMLIHLAKQTRQSGWLTGYHRHVLTDSQSTYLDLEAYAIRVRSYVHATVPELLQTDDYAAALIAASRSVRPLTARPLTHIRIARRRLLTREPRPAQFEFILDEATLHRIVGQPTVMASQLRALAERATLPHVTVRTVPYRTGLYPGLDIGAFTILDFPTDEKFGGLPTTVYCHRLGESTAVDTPHDTDTYQEHWNTSRAYALDPHVSQRLITDTADQTAAMTLLGNPEPDRAGTGVNWKPAATTDPPGQAEPGNPSPTTPTKEARRVL